jgi:ribosomal protein S19
MGGEQKQLKTLEPLEVNLQNSNKFGFFFTPPFKKFLFFPMSYRYFSFGKRVRAVYKVSHIGHNTWRQMFLHISSEVIEEQDKFIHEKSSTVSPVFKESKLRIYTGRGYISRQLNSYMTGFKFGEFT